MESLFKINPLDNVYVVGRKIEPMEVFLIEGNTYQCNYVLGLGHKIAAVFIPKGRPIFKFGIPIGSATEDIPPGTHVHLHNLTSNYLPTYTLDHGFESH